VRGYARCTIGPERCMTEFQAMNEVVSTDGEATTLASFIVENGRPGMIES
jgi:alkaline phosphatase D